MEKKKKLLLSAINFLSFKLYLKKVFLVLLFQLDPHHEQVRLRQVLLIKLLWMRERRRGGWFNHKCLCFGSPHPHNNTQAFGQEQKNIPTTKQTVIIHSHSNLHEFISLFFIYFSYLYICIATAGHTSLPFPPDLSFYFFSFHFPFPEKKLSCKSGGENGLFVWLNKM